MPLTRRWSLASKWQPYSKPTLLLRLCKPGDSNFFMLPHAANALATIVAAQYIYIDICVVICIFVYIYI